LVGGTVVGLARNAKYTLVNVNDKKYSDDHCAIRVIEKRKKDGAPVKINIGDSIWWQSGLAMWTPKGAKTVGAGQGETWDIVLTKVGYSH
jgi:hypothetical protein